MKLKVLVTGTSKKIVSDISGHLEVDRGYSTVKCLPDKELLADMFMSELPRVVVICLGDETRETIAAYDVFKVQSVKGECTVIAITDDENEKFFTKYTNLGRVFFLSRPVSLFTLYEKLSSIEIELESKLKMKEYSFREFVNEKTVKTYDRKNILVVDDDPEQLVHIKEQLEEFYNVVCVKSGDAAFKYLSKHIPDLILLDYLMPDMDGPAVLRKMRADKILTQIPVMFLTGMTEKKQIFQTLTELRPQGYVIKPSKKSEIVAAIIEILG